MAGFPVTHRAGFRESSLPRIAAGSLPSTLDILSAVAPAPSGSAATDRTNLNNAIAAAGSAGIAGLRPGTYLIDQMVTVPDGVSLRAAGASHQLGGTTIQCTAAGAGVTFLGRGGPTMGIRIDGNAVANQPWVVGAGLGRTFISVSSSGAAQDGLTINSLQNTTFIDCGIQTAARDGIVLDLGCGGLHFHGIEVTNSGRYSVHFQQSGASPGNAYSTFFGPTDIDFYGGVLERQTTDQPVVQVDQGTNLYFNRVNFSRALAGATSAVAYIADWPGGVAATRIEFNSCVWSATATAAANVRPGQSQLVVLTGLNKEVGGAPLIDGSNTSAPVHVFGTQDLAGGGTLFTAGTPNNGQSSVYEPAQVHKFWQLALGNLFARNRAPGESFDRFQWFGSGAFILGSGAATPDTTLSRLAPKVLGVTGAIRNGVAAPAYGAPTAIDPGQGTWQTVTVTNNTGFSISAPNPAPSSTTTQDLVIEIFNNSGGAMGAITWNAAYVFNGFTWANPASTKRRFAKFGWNGTSWVCVSMSGADY